MPNITTNDEGVHTFLESLDLSKHPLAKARSKLVKEYYSALAHIVYSTINQTRIPNDKTYRYISGLLQIYSDTFNLSPSDLKTVDDIGLEYHIDFFAKPWRKKYFNILLCDIALVLLNRNLYLQAMDIISQKAPKRIHNSIVQMGTFIIDEQAIDSKHLYLLPLFQQYHMNSRFLLQKERRIIITANMSAGKSTLINALVGKSVARTSQEVCTGNICYIYNKAFEDGKVNLETRNLCLGASSEDLINYDWDGQISISSYFSPVTATIPRLCLIDTPGVDAALHKEHCKRTRESLLHDIYDIILYVVSPTRLGTDAEKKHLKWVAENISKEKIIFILNKLDDFHDFSDSVEESVQGFRNDLINLGFENPVICPTSAYFAFLLKKKMSGQAFTDDEADEYEFLSKKFMRNSYDLSSYYNNSQCLPNDTEELVLSKRSGLYGIEQLIYGGAI